MALAPFDTYCADSAADQFQMRRWLMRAIVLSLCLHAWLVAFFYFKEVKSFRIEESAPFAPPAQPWRMVNLSEPSEVPAKVTPKNEPAPMKAIPLAADVLALEKAGEVGLTVPERVSPPLRTEALAGIGGLGTGGATDTIAQWTLQNSLRADVDRLMAKGTHLDGDLPANATAPWKDLAGDGADAAGIPGRQTLDEALARAVPQMTGETRVECSSGGALYEYNSYELRPSAVGELRKLGDLIGRYPRAVFRIEGHTDSVGTHDYNQWLSEKRAESVKLWLVQYMGVAPERIETRGFGSSRLLVPADRSVEEQQINRRVEIVIEPAR
jgi:outer membrane protein OmpA-like peptidoglycan-associated protein